MKVGGAEQRIGLAERDFVGSAIADYMEPMQKFLDTDMKAIARERKLLDNKRWGATAKTKALKKKKNKKKKK